MVRRRYSQQWELIYQYVKEAHCHPTAEMVYQALKAACPTLSRGTVYRNLNRLAEEGAIVKMNFPVERYDGTLAPHAHLLCSTCGAVADLPLAYDSALDRCADEQCGWQITRHECLFHGRCPSCQGQANSKQGADT